MNKQYENGSVPGVYHGKGTQSYVPLVGRPERSTVIGDDDITNLKIALNTCTSLEDFLEKV